MNYKYSINQQIIVEIEGKNWDDLYETPSKIIGICDYFINAVPVYIIETHYGRVMEIREDKINLKENK